VIARIGRGDKEKGPQFLGRRPFGVAATSNSRPSGAQGRKTVKISGRLDPYHLTVRLRTAMSGVLRSSFFGGSIFLFFLTGFAVGFMIPSLFLGVVPSGLVQTKCNSPAKRTSLSWA
jgi:hypothetical protein